MSALNKFTFISPGIFVSEIDESQNPIAPEVMGPVIIGRTTKGPAMRPVKVNSIQEYIDTFGEEHIMVMFGETEHFPAQHMQVMQLKHGFLPALPLQL